MFCENCGKKLLGIEKFCGACGAPVEQMESVQVNEILQPVDLSTEKVDNQQIASVRAASDEIHTTERRNVYSIVTPSLLIEEIEKADDTLVQMEPYEADIYDCQKQLGSIKTMGTIIRGILIFLAIIFAVAGYNDVASLMSIVCAIAAIVVPSMYKKNASKPINERINQDSCYMNDILSRTESCIPTRYIYANGINYMKELIGSGRANTLAEAIDKLEEQEHRWGIEAQNNEIIRQQQEQSNELRSIKWATWANYWRR